MQQRLAVDFLLVVPSELWMYFIFRIALEAYLFTQAASDSTVLPLLIIYVKKECAYQYPDVVYYKHISDLSAVQTQIESRLFDM